MVSFPLNYLSLFCQDFQSTPVSISMQVLKNREVAVLEMSSQDPFPSPLKDHSSAANEEHQVLHNFVAGEVGKKTLFSSFFLQSL